MKKRQALAISLSLLMAVSVVAPAQAADSWPLEEIEVSVADDAEFTEEQAGQELSLDVVETSEDDLVDFQMTDVLDARNDTEVIDQSGESENQNDEESYGIVIEEIVPEEEWTTGENTDTDVPMEELETETSNEQEDIISETESAPEFVSEDELIFEAEDVVETEDETACEMESETEKKAEVNSEVMETEEVCLEIEESTELDYTPDLELISEDIEEQIALMEYMAEPSEEEVAANISSAQTLEIGKTYQSSTEGDEFVYFKFTPDESTEGMFSFGLPEWVSVYVYELKNNQLVYDFKLYQFDDDDLVFEMSAGVTYYFAVYGFDDEDSISFKKVTTNVASISIRTNDEVVSGFDEWRITIGYNYYKGAYEEEDDDDDDEIHYRYFKNNGSRFFTDDYGNIFTNTFYRITEDGSIGSEVDFSSDMSGDYTVKVSGGGVTTRADVHFVTLKEAASRHEVTEDAANAFTIENSNIRTASLYALFQPQEDGDYLFCLDNGFDINIYELTEDGYQIPEQWNGSAKTQATLEKNKKYAIRMTDFEEENLTLSVTKINNVENINFTNQSVTSSALQWAQDIFRIPVVVTYEDGTTETVNQWEFDSNKKILQAFTNTGKRLILEVLEEDEEGKLNNIDIQYYYQYTGNDGTEFIDPGQYTVKVYLSSDSQNVQTIPLTITSLPEDAEVLNLNEKKEVFLSDYGSFAFWIDPQEDENYYLTYTFISGEGDYYLYQLTENNTLQLISTDSKDWDLKANARYLLYYRMNKTYYDRSGTLLLRMNREVADIELDQEATVLRSEIWNYLYSVPVMVTYTDSSQEVLPVWGGWTWFGNQNLGGEFQENSTIVLELKNSLGVKVDMQSFGNIYYNLPFGDYTLKAYLSENPSISSSQVLHYVTPVATDLLSEDGTLVNGGINEISCTENESKYFRIVPDETSAGNYVIYSSGYATNVIVCLSEIQDGKWVDVESDLYYNNFKLSYSFQAGKEYYYEVKAAETTDLIVHFEKERDVFGENNGGMITELLNADGSLTNNGIHEVSCEPGEIKYFRIVPDETSAGTYIIYPSDTGKDTYVVLYEMQDGELIRIASNDDGGYKNLDFELSYKLQAGKEYYYGVRVFDEDETVDFTVHFDQDVKVQSELLNADGSLANEGVYKISCESYEKKYFRIVPDENSAGTYVIYSSDTDKDPYVTLYEKQNGELVYITSNNNGGENLNFRLSYNLQAGKTYYYCVALRDYETVDFTLHFEKVQDASNDDNNKELSIESSVDLLSSDGSLINGGIHEVSCAADEIKYFRIVPDETSAGTYVIYSSNTDEDTYVTLYKLQDEKMIKLTDDDDGGEDYNFKLSYDLQAGKEYYYEVREFSYEAANFTVHFEKVQDTSAESHVHQWDEGTITKTATCLQTGIITYACAGCDETKEETIPFTQHVWQTIIDQAATCGVTGSQHRECSICGTKESSTEIKATEKHTWMTIVDQAATCGATGSQHRECSICGTKEESTEIKATEKHTWTTIVDQAATCGATGSQHRECSICGTRKESTEIKATGSHTWTTIVDQAATCGVAGSQHRECSICGKKEASTEIKATGKHTWTTIIDKAATCGTAGKQHRECTVCGQKKSATTIGATGKHDYGAYTVTKEPTALKAGEKTRICSVCKKEDTASVKKLKATISVNVKSLTLQTKQSSEVIEVTGLAKGDAVKSWKSSNTKIVKVDKTGKLTAQSKTGKATVTVTLKSGKTAKITVTVQKSTVRTEKITGLKKTVSLKKGKKTTLSPVLTPLTSQEKITYSTSDKKVATVSSKGVVTAKGTGTAKITVQSGSKKIIVTVKVKK
jgi:hypothetical protein